MGEHCVENLQRQLILWQREPAMFYTARNLLSKLVWFTRNFHRAAVIAFLDKHAAKSLKQNGHQTGSRVSFKITVQKLCSPEQYEAI